MIVEAGEGRQDKNTKRNDPKKSAIKARSAEIDFSQSGVSRNTDEHLACAGHNRPQRPAWKEEFHRTDGTNTEGLIVRTQQSAGIEKQIRTLTLDARHRPDFQLRFSRQRFSGDNSVELSADRC